VFIGVAMIFNASFEYALGIVLSLSAAFFASLFSTMNSKLVEQDKPVRIAFWEMAFALLAIALFGLLTAGSETYVPTSRDWMLLLVLGVLCTGTPFTCAIAINMEPVYTIAAAIFLYGQSEWMAPGFYIGAAIIMTTIFLDILMKRRRRAKG
jgi:drug/metabolite transporter (DMT)-like permease